MFWSLETSLIALVCLKNPTRAYTLKSIFSLVD